MEWTTQYGLGTMDYTLWTTQCSTHYCLGVVHYEYALLSLHYTKRTVRYAVSSSGKFVVETTMHCSIVYTLCTMHYVLYTMHFALCIMHYALFIMQCLPLVNLWWKPPQPWLCQTRPTSWVKHTGKRQRLKMDTKQKYQLSIYARKEYGASSP